MCIRDRIEELLNLLFARGANAHKPVGVAVVEVEGADNVISLNQLLELPTKLVELRLLNLNFNVFTQ